ncbi:Uncharacterised protein [uncultured archaeon]|nr:Uncharacterised protein [uncultured archaeon]
MARACGHSLQRHLCPECTIITIQENKLLLLAVYDCLDLLYILIIDETITIGICKLSLFFVATDDIICICYIVLVYCIIHIGIAKYFQCKGCTAS